MQANEDLFNLLTNTIKADDVEIAGKIAKKMLEICDEIYISTCLKSLPDKPHELATHIQSLLKKPT